MLTFKINGSSKAGEKVGKLFEKGYFNDYLCEIYTLDYRNAVGHFKYDPYSSIFSCDNNHFDVFSINLISVRCSPGHEYHIEDLSKVSFETLEAEIKPLIAGSNSFNSNIYSIDDWKRAIEEVGKEATEFLRMMADAGRELGCLDSSSSEEKKSGKSSVLDAVVGEAKSSKQQRINTVVFKETNGDYDDSLYVLNEMIVKHLEEGRQVLSSGVYFSREIEKYMIYAIGL